MATINWTTIGASMIDTSLVPDVTIERADGLTTPATGESVVIRSTFTQQITGFGGGIVLFTDANNLDGSTETPTPTGAGTVYEQVVNLPQGSKGTFHYYITAQSVFSVGGKYGPPSTRSLEVQYNTETPDVVLSRHLQNTERDESVLVIATWNHGVTGFTESDLMAVWATEPELEGTIDNFSTTNAFIYPFRVNFPDNTRGEVVITVPENAATSVINSAKDGPPADRSITIPFDRTGGELPEVPPPATLEISEPLIATYGLKRYTTRFQWSRGVTGFLASDVDVDVISGSGSVAKGTLVPDEDTVGLYRIQLTLSGSGRVRVRVQANQALAGTVESPEADVEVEWDFDVQDAVTTVDGVTELCNETFSIDDNPYLDSVLSFSGEHAGGAFFGISDLKVHNNKVYGVVQIRKRREGAVNELSITDQAGAVLFMVDATGCRILKAYPFVARAARSLVVHDDAIHFFEGSHYQYYDSWIPPRIPTIKEIGYVYRIDKDSNAISEVGLNWRSVLPSTPEDRVEGLHGGTASPMLSTPDGLQVIAGWGNLDDVTEGLNTATGRFPIATDVENWQWVEHNNYLDFIVSVLQTNGIRAWEVLESLARTTNSVMGYSSGEFSFKSREPLKARLNQSLSTGDVGSGISYNQANRDFPEQGLIYIDGELLRYTGITATTFTGLTRAQHDTVATSHMEGADIYFVNAVLDANSYAQPINNLSLKIDTTRVYNEIIVTYGDAIRGERKKAVVKSQPSIQLHGKQVFEIDVELDNHQVLWAEWLAKSLLDYYSDEHFDLSVTLQSTFHLRITDVVFISEPHRSQVKHLGQVRDFQQNYNGKTTRLEIRTI